MAWYNSISDLKSSIGSNPVDGAMSSIGLGNDVIADSPIGSFLGMAQNKEAKRQFNTSLDWQKYQFNKQVEMMNTAHQREIADLEKSGLNPVLSANGSGLGAPTGIGSVSPTAHMDNGSAGLGFITNLIQSISGIKNSNSAQTVAQATDKKATAEAKLLNAEADSIRSGIPLKLQESSQAQGLVEATMSRSPRNAVPSMVKGVGDVINEGSHTQTASKFEAYGKRVGLNEIKLEDSKIMKALDKLDKKSKGITKVYTRPLRGALYLYNALRSIPE